MTQWKGKYNYIKNSWLKKTAEIKAALLSFLAVKANMEPIQSRFYHQISLPRCWEVECPKATPLSCPQRCR